MTNLNALLEERKKVWDRMQEIRTQAEANENGEFSAEQRTNWDAAQTRLAELSGDIERSQQGDSIQRQMESLQAPRLTDAVTPAANEEPSERSANDRFGEAFDAFARRGISGLSPSSATSWRASSSAPTRTSSAPCPSAPTPLVATRCPRASVTSSSRR
jgi:HK97 family phage major capsid protein